MTSKGITVVIPAFNEEAFLPATLDSVSKAILLFERSTGYPAEIVVINNNSTDCTHEVAETYGANVIF